MAACYADGCRDLPPPQTNPDAMLGSGRKEVSMPRLRHTVEQILATRRGAEFSRDTYFNIDARHGIRPRASAPS